MASKYPEIKKYILQQIDDHVYQENIMLPPEKTFTELFNVSRMTVRRALDELIQDGILYRKQGSGVFLAKHKIKRSVTKISTQHDEELKKTFKEMSIKVIDLKVVHDHYIVRKYLGLKDADAYQIKRVQLGDQQPIVYENIFLPCQYFPTVTKEDLYHSMSNIKGIQTLIEEKKLSNHITVEAKVATKRLSSLLQIPVNDPILQLTIVVMDPEGNKYYCGINHYPGDRYSYVTE